MTLPSQLTPGPDHDAPATGLLASLPFRTLLQGLALDVLLAVCLVVYDATSGDAVDWRLLGLALMRTVLQTAASSLMRRLKPPASA